MIDSNLDVLRKQLNDATDRAEYQRKESRDHRAWALQSDELARFWDSQATVLRRHIAALQAQGAPA